MFSYENVLFIIYVVYSYCMCIYYCYLVDSIINSDQFLYIHRYFFSLVNYQSFRDNNNNNNIYLIIIIIFI